MSAALAVFKYPLRVTDIQEIKLPLGAEILTVQEQYGQLVLWALVDPSQTSTRTRRIHIAGTGHYLYRDLGQYLTTVQQEGGTLVWHIFVNLEKTLPDPQTTAQVHNEISSRSPLATQPARPRAIRKTL